MGLDLALAWKRVAFAILLPGILFARISHAACVNCHSNEKHYNNLGSCVSCHGGMETTDRKSIAHTGLLAARFANHLLPASAQVKRGNKIVEAFSCRRCHLTAGIGNGLAANLDEAVLRETAQTLLKSIRSPSLFMPDFKFSEEQLTDVTNAILTNAKRRSARKKQKENEEIPQLIHFEDDTPEHGSVFEKHCGGCHRAISASEGPLGRSNAGPNLSGFFSAHYPKTSEGQTSWTELSLKKWLRNPRAVNKQARMPPLENAGYSEPANWEKLMKEISSLSHK